MFSKLKDFGYTKIPDSKPRLTKKEKKELLEHQEKLKREAQNELPRTVSCSNNNCVAILGYIYKTVHSRNIAIKESGWRDYGYGMILCPLPRQDFCPKPRAWQPSCWTTYKLTKS